MSCKCDTGRARDEDRCPIHGGVFSEIPGPRIDRREKEAVERLTLRAAQGHAAGRADRDGKTMAIYRCRRHDCPDVFYVRPLDEEAPDADLVETVEPLDDAG